MNKNKVNIIIPIYNSYESVIKCIGSVIKNTPKEEYNLIIINDNSTDERIINYLLNLENKKFDNIFILHNNQYLGFIESINIGIRFDTDYNKEDKIINDVLLLNSLTEVTKNWLKKIKNVAYSKENIGTVVPLTNDNSIFTNLEYDERIKINNLEKYSQLIENTSIKLYPETSISIGSCMYIKRNVIDEIGPFQYESYPEEYLKKNIFYLNLKGKNYINILCDDTFIYKENNNIKNLNQESYRYNINNNFKIPKQFLSIKNNINLQLKIRNAKTNVLFISHNDISGRDGFIGGTEIHINDLIYNISEINSFLLYIDNDYMHLNAYIDENILNFKFKLDKKISTLDFTNKQYKDYLDNIVKYFNINCIHVQHFFRHTFDVVDIAKQYNIPIYLTLHDYYLICPKVNLLDQNDEYCLDKISLNKCNKCLKKTYGYENNTILKWNTIVYKYLKKFDRIFAPSKSVVENFKKYYINMYKEFNINIEVIEHGTTSLFINNRKKSDIFRIAFVGSMVPHKGSGLIYDIITQNKNSNIEWHIFGNIRDNKLNLLQNKSLIKHGKYEANQIQNLLISNNIDLVCILSICPETYSYTLNESISSRIPVLVSGLGALNERVSKYNCGWILNEELSSQYILNYINKIINNKDEYISKLSSLDKLKLLSKEDECNRYKNIYLDINNKALNTNYKINRYMLNANYKIDTIDNEIATVMMLSYNNLQYMKSAIKSVLKQTYKQIELIINDDGSKEFDNEFVNDIRLYIEENKGNNLINYRIEKNEVNVGIVKSYNKIINLAKGNYLIPLCCDDEFYDENTIKSIVQYFNSSDKLIVTGYRACYDENLKHFNCLKPQKEDIDYLYKSPIELYEYLCKDNFIAGACTSYTKKFIEEYGKFDEDYVLLEDWGKYLNITRRGCSIGFINSILIKYREGGITTSKINNTKSKRILLNDVSVLKNKEILPYKKSIQRVSNLGNYKINDSYSNDINIQQIKDFKINSRPIHLTSIVILTYNQLEYTKLCIESIRKFTPQNSYEIIVVDNGSSDGTVDWLKEQKDIKTIFNKENMGFSKGCNQGIDVSVGENILLLNNDTIVTPNWLYNMDRALWKEDKIAAVSCMSNYVTNNQQIEVKYTNIYSMLEFALDFNILNFNKHEPMDKLIGFCMLIKKEVINKIGLLDENFVVGNFEDDDYCLRMKKAGYKLILCKDTFIHHFGSISFKNTPQLDIFEISRINEEKFKNKWNL